MYFSYSFKPKHLPESEYVFSSGSNSQSEYPLATNSDYVRLKEEIWLSDYGIICIGMPEYLLKSDSDNNYLQRIDAQSKN